MSETPNYITPRGYQVLAAELTQLQRVERPKVVTEVRDAAAQGDRSENAEYIYGKKRLREIDRRMRFLHKRLAAAKVVNPGEISGDTVRFGATVEIENEQGARLTYQLVGVDESNPAEGRINWQSPIGRALMNRSVDDDVSYRKPDGETVDLTIVSVRYEAQ